MPVGASQRWHIACGRHADVWADIVRGGHDQFVAAVKYRRARDRRSIRSGGPTRADEPYEIRDLLRDAPAVLFDVWRA